MIPSLQRNMPAHVGDHQESQRSFQSEVVLDEGEVSSHGLVAIGYEWVANHTFLN